jgi:uncharacterized membrane-anchored protein
MRGLPKINASYWLTLGAASVFGTNTGDLVSDTFHIGHLNGLPYLAVALAMVFLAERLSTWANPLFFWLVIILVRTAATNVGDAFHDFHIGFNLSLPIAAACFAAAVCAYTKFSPRQKGDEGNVRVSPLYWLCMVLAGILGTVGGDFVSFGIGIMPPGTAVVVGALAVLALYKGRAGASLHPVYYWITLALIRTAGTGGGDALSHGFLSMPVAAALTGAVFIGLVIRFYVLRQDNQASLSPALPVGIAAE